MTARRQATVSAQITGALTQVLIEEGEHVNAGQVLARLDDTSQRAARAQAQAQLEAAQARSREIATLRAIGFLSLPLVLSVLLETMFLAALGGSIGAAIAWLVFDGFTTSTVGNSGQLVFAFNISPALLWNGLKWPWRSGLSVDCSPPSAQLACP